MASSKVVTTNPDLPRQSSICSLSSIMADLQHNTNNSNNDPSKTLPSISSMDDLLKSFYSPSSETNNHDPTHIHPDPNLGDPKEEMSTKTVDEVWKEMVVGGSDHRRVGAGEGLEQMTLEDFLTKAGATNEDNVGGVPNVVAGPGNYAVDPVSINGAAAHFPMPAQGMEGSSVEAFGNRIDGAVVGVAAPGRGKRRPVEEPLDKATLQKQRRMIKNRESAARSRERKQAYTVELETLVTQLEEENVRLLKEQADLNKQRLNQLMEHVIPVVEKRKPRPMLRRVNSVQW
ncbi:hypothetical protein L6164_032527 [Bauhinia variegata]|uniref:Uncharacterized protein n=1 Tax=Bauhinia variegata TaxID=167791 RepID=A0ACB9KNY0_BAUVA|nr:hypothetical protein L6164_032527 [Bauhinia variegata]